MSGEKISITESFSISQAQQEVLKELNTLYTDCDHGTGQIIFNNLSKERKTEQARSNP